MPRAQQASACCLEERHVVRLGGCGGCTIFCLDCATTYVEK